MSERYAHTPGGTYEATPCNDCGCVVFDQEKHNEWHQHLESLVYEEDEWGKKFRE